jgi:hypothetical protein
MLDLSAWVSIVNLSGASFRDARLKLIAGDVQRAPENRLRSVAAVAMVAGADSDAGFSQKSFSEYHLYTLGRRTDLPDNSTRQLELFEQVKQIPAKKLLVYRGSEVGFGGVILDRDFGTTSGSRSVDVFLEFQNNRANGLGIPLPAGRIRVSQLDDADGSLEFIGEDRIDHTPREERVRIKLGTAFDIVGERRQVDYAIDMRARWLEEEVEITVRNRKNEAAEVLIVESLVRTGQWKMLKQSQESTKLDARQIQFVTKLPKDGETVVRYRVRYTW